MDIALSRTAETSPGGDPAGPRSAAEWAARRDLAAAYRLVARFGWDDLLATHLSARVPGEPGAFLINPLGLLFEEITASSLVKIDHAGEILEDTPHAVNRAGFVIHSAIHAARADANCVIHLHTLDGIAVASLAEGLLPTNQTAVLAGAGLSRHAWEGVAVDEGERERLAADLGPVNKAMLLDSHGTLVLGESVAEAFLAAYFLERACTIQVRTLAMGRALAPVDAEVIATTQARFGASASAEAAAYARTLVWPALLRRLERECPDYAN